MDGRVNVNDQLSNMQFTLACNVVAVLLFTNQPGCIVITSLI